MIDLAKVNWWMLAICVVGTIGLGAIGSLLGGDTVAFSQLNQPPLSPPGMVFGIVWTLLYATIGVSLYLVLSLAPTSDTQAILKRSYIIIWAVGMLLNIFWTFFFFRLDMRVFSLVWLIAIIFAASALIIVSFNLLPSSGWILLPYLIWLCFACYLNIGIIMYN